MILLKLQSSLIHGLRDCEANTYGTVMVEQSIQIYFDTLKDKPVYFLQSKSKQRYLRDKSSLTTGPYLHVLEKEH